MSVTAATTPEFIAHRIDIYMDGVDIKGCTGEQSCAYAHVESGTIGTVHSVYAIAHDTSGNARQVIEAIPRDQEILFLPDLYLGLWLENVTGRKLIVWMGECHVHAGIRPADIERWQEEAPDAELLVHPECGCASQAMAANAASCIAAENADPGSVQPSTSSNMAFEAS